MKEQDCKFVPRDSIDTEDLRPDQVLVRTVEDAKRVMFSVAYDLANGEQPQSVESLAELMFMATQMATAKMLAAATMAAAESGVGPETAAASTGHSLRLMAKAASEIVTEAVSKFVESKTNPFYVNN